MKKLLSLIAILIFLSSCIYINVPQGYGEYPISKPKIKEIVKIFKFQPKSLFKINSQIGEYNIKGHFKKEFSFKGKIEASTVDFFYDTDFSIKKLKDNIIMLNASVFKKSASQVNIEGDISLPFETNIEGIFDNAKLTLNSVRGNINIVSDYINLTLADVSGNIKVKTRNGHVKLTILEWEKDDSFSIIADGGKIEFYAPKEASLDLIVDAPDNKVEKKFEFKKGKTKVYLKIKKGEIIVDKI